MKVEEIDEFSAKINGIYFDSPLVFDETKLSLKLLEHIAKVDSKITRLFKDTYEIAYDDMLESGNKKLYNKIYDIINWQLFKENISLDKYKQDLKNDLIEFYNVEDLTGIDNLEPADANTKNSTIQIEEISEFKAKINNVLIKNQYVYEEVLKTLEALEKIADTNEEITEVYTIVYSEALTNQLIDIYDTSFNDAKDIMLTPLEDRSMNLDEYKEHLIENISRMDEIHIEDLEDKINSLKEPHTKILDYPRPFEL